MKFDKENNQFILTADELSVLEDVVTSLKAIDNKAALSELKQEIINADLVLSRLPKHWWATSKRLEEKRKNE